MGCWWWWRWWCAAVAVATVDYEHPTKVLHHSEVNKYRCWGCHYRNPNPKHAESSTPSTTLPDRTPTKQQPPTNSLAKPPTKRFVQQALHAPGLPYLKPGIATEAAEASSARTRARGIRTGNDSPIPKILFLIRIHQYRYTASRPFIDTCIQQFNNLAGPTTQIIE